MRIIYLSENIAPAVVPTIVLESIDVITTSSVTCTANITSDGGSTITARGIEVNTMSDFSGFYIASNPDSGTTGRFTITANPLTLGTFYYVRAFAANSVGFSFSNVMTFTSASVVTLPSIVLNSVSDITSNGSTFVSTVTSDGGAAITARGCNFYTNSDCSGTPVMVNQNPQTGSYNSTVQTLAPETAYYGRAWAENSVGTTKSNVIGFTTASTATVPVVLLNSITDVSLNSASYSVSILSDGGTYITRRGCNFYTNADFSGESIGSVYTGSEWNFIGAVSQLLPQTTYYARAWAENAYYTGFSSVISFTTSASGDVEIDIVEPDYIVMRYIWGTEDGQDLDTMTEFTTSGVTGLDYLPVGYARNGQSRFNVLNILKWGGDNTQSGQENVLIDITVLRNSSGLIETSIIEFYATWYLRKFDRHTCTIELKAYRGGVMSKINQFEYQNTGGSLIYSSDSTTKSVDSANTWKLPEPYIYTVDTFRDSYTKLGRLEYKKSTNRAKLIF